MKTKITFERACKKMNGEEEGREKKEERDVSEESYKEILANWVFGRECGSRRSQMYD